MSDLGIAGNAGGFWAVLGWLLLMNSGLVIGGVRSYFRRLEKIEKDIKAAHDLIRELKNNFAEKTSSDQIPSWRKK